MALSFLTLTPSLIHAQAVWSRLSNGVYPWSIATDMVEFNAAGFVSANGARDQSSTRLWKTTNWQTWQPVFISQNLVDVERITVTNGTLFAFGHLYEPILQSTSAVVFRSQDGEVWETFTTGAMNDSRHWGDVEAFGNFIYVSSSTTSYPFRFNVSDPDNWTEITSGLGLPAVYEFATFKNTLFVARTAIGASLAQIYKSQDGTMWDFLNTLSRPSDVSDTIDKHNFAVYRDELLFSFGQIFRYSEGKEEWSAATNIEFKRNFLIFSVFNQLHTKLGPNAPGFNGAIFRRVGTTWQGNLDSVGKNFLMNNVPIVHTPGNAYVLLGDIWQASGGARLVQKEPFVIDVLETGSTSKTVFAWSITADFSDTVTKLVVENKGSAENGLDISKLTLYRGTTALMDLVPVPGKTKEWQLPLNPGNFVTLEGDNDIFYLKADIAPNVREGKNIQMSILANGFVCAENPNYTLATDLTSMVPMSIQAIGVNSVSLMPFPAENFMPNDKDILALKFNVTYYSSETLRSITIINKGDAEAGVDIDRVKLRITNDQSIMVIELNPQGNGKTWTSSNAWQGYKFIGNEQFEILINIGAAARNTRRIQLSLPSNAFLWEVNNDFSLASDLIEDDVLSQPTFAPGPIPDVLIFPQPARDTVRFSYDLPTDADITVNIYDLTGILVSEIRESKTAALGTQTLWDASAKAPGSYFAVIKIKPATGDTRIYKRKVFIKK